MEEQIVDRILEHRSTIVFANSRRLAERLTARLNEIATAIHHTAMAVSVGTLVLGTILANLKNREIELRRPGTDDEVVEVLRKGVKIRREAVEQYTAAGRQDYLDYLNPAPMPGPVARLPSRAKLWKGEWGSNTVSR